MAGKENDDANGPVAGSGGHYGYHGHHHHGGGATIGSHDVVDPVCGKSIDPHMTREYSDYKGKRLHFCSSECRSRFDQAPDRYL
ncbi:MULTISPECIES: YHS domain-containing protein [unclassified Sphingomonas]|uniref:YHS domain-containing protein n=1 Tax=unclassified Sphingomonas TaxID=196159 RepID=UPI001AC81BCE|nr:MULTISPECIES: YHS domain-containing protein [unclassified Sphingomonas]MBN8847333.1 YHS domain-containing protein [Sphingomonas sp.]